jgi:uncharacterized protein YciI
VSFVVLMRPARPGVEEQQDVLAAHWDYLRGLHADGKLVAAGPSWFGDDPFGVGIFPLDDRDELDALIAADPAVTSGWLTPEIRPIWLVVGK